MTRTKEEQEKGLEKVQAAAVADNIYGQVTWPEEEEEVEEAQQDNTGHKTKANATEYANADADAKLRQLEYLFAFLRLLYLLVSLRIFCRLLYVLLFLFLCVCVWADICNFILPRTTNNGTAGGHSSARSLTGPRPRPGLIRTWCLLNASWATLDKGAKPLGRGGGPAHKKLCSTKALTTLPGLSCPAPPPLLLLTLFLIVCLVTFIALL